MQCRYKVLRRWLAKVEHFILIYREKKMAVQMKGKRNKQPPSLFIISTRNGGPCLDLRIDGTYSLRGSRPEIPSFEEGKEHFPLFATLYLSLSPSPLSVSSFCPSPTIDATPGEQEKGFIRFAKAPLRARSLPSFSCNPTLPLVASNGSRPIRICLPPPPHGVTQAPTERSFL